MSEPQDDFAPIEVFERIAERYFEDKVKPTIESLARELGETKGALQAEKQARELVEAELALTRKDISALADALTKNSALLAVEARNSKVRDAIAMIKISYTSAIHVDVADHGLLARKYEAVTSQLQHVADPWNLAAQFNAFVIDHCASVGASIIRTGLSTGAK